MPVLGQLHFHDGVHRTRVGCIGRRPVGRHADFADDQFQVVVQRSRERNLRPWRSFVRSARCGCRRGRAHRFRTTRHRPRERIRGAGLGAKISTVATSSPAPMAIVLRGCRSTTSSPSDVTFDHPVDALLPAGERARPIGFVDFGACSACGFNNRALNDGTNVRESRYAQIIAKATASAIGR